MDDPYTSLDIKTFRTDREDPRSIGRPPPDQGRHDPVVSVRLTERN
jgi:hypothetical protein